MTIPAAVSMAKRKPQQAACMSMAKAFFMPIRPITMLEVEGKW